MENNQKLYKVFTLIRLLNTPPAKTAQQLMRQLDVKKTQFYRYINLLKEIGYTIDKDAKHRFSFQFIDHEVHKKGLTKDMLGSDELGYLHELLQSQTALSPLAESILHKFDRHLSLAPLADALPQLHRSRMIQLIRFGINRNRELTLRGYRSLTGNRISDRHVEPLDITADHRYLIAWDLDKDDQRQFKIERITDVEVLETAFKPGRTSSPMDIFGLTGTQWYDVKMKLGTNPHNLLIEEFPLSRAYIRTRNGEVFFEGQVRNFKGIGRFVLGFPGEVEVIAPEAFKAYLKKKIELF